MSYGNEAEVVTREYLCKLPGCSTVEKLPESQVPGEMTADFRVSFDQGESCLVEVASRKDSRRHAFDREASIPGQWRTLYRLGVWEHIPTKFERAKDQFDHTRRRFGVPESCANVLTFILQDDDSFALNAVAYALYGIRLFQVGVLGSHRCPLVAVCCGATSLFAKYPSIDAVLIRHHGWTLWSNEGSRVHTTGLALGAPARDRTQAANLLSGIAESWTAPPNIEEDAGLVQWARDAHNAELLQEIFVPHMEYSLTMALPVPHVVPV